MALKIELHSQACSCHGGSWAQIGGASVTPCRPAAEIDKPLVVEFSAWKALGKPPSLEVYREAAERAEKGEKRAFQRFHARLPIRLSRIASWRDPSAQAEETETEVIAQGGALVRTHMVVESGEILVFQHASYRSRAEAGYVAEAKAPDGAPFLRVGLRFLDAPFPEALIPKDAEPA